MIVIVMSMLNAGIIIITHIIITIGIIIVTIGVITNMIVVVIVYSIFYVSSLCVLVYAIDATASLDQR